MTTGSPIPAPIRAAAVTDQAPVALCAGKWELFDSTHTAAHKLAAELCAVCPMRAQCDDILLETRRDQMIAGASYGPHGTWAGKLIGVDGRRST